jgi:hypothetical protein
MMWSVPGPLGAGARGAVGALACAALATIALAACASAQQCDSVWSRTSLSEMTGRRVRAVRIETREPVSLPLVLALLDHLHVRTRDATIRRLLLIAAGDTVDTLRVAESLRRLRQLRYLSDAVVLATGCGDGPVDLAVLTQDLWSVRPSLNVRPTSQSLTLTERNIFGTGREATIGLKSDVNGIAPSAALRDPWFLGKDITLGLTTTGSAARGARAVTVQKRERSILDPFGLEGSVQSSAFDADKLDTGAVGGQAVESLRRLGATAIASRRVHLSLSAVTHLMIGGEYDRMEWEPPLYGDAILLREFVGIGGGLRRRSVAYDTVTWYLPDNALVDVPLSFEYDAFISMGQDRATGAPALHVDAWAGQMWFLGRSALLVGNVWGSGFRTAGRWSAATLRGAVNYERAARRGLWNARLGVERWFGPDPDLRMAVTADPTIRALGSDARRATNAVVVSVERAVHVRRLTRSYTLDAAVFGAASSRTTAHVGTLGFGLRLAPARLGRVTARLDFEVPVLRSGDVLGRPFVAAGITPWLEQDRQRDGRGMR